MGQLLCTRELPDRLEKLFNCSLHYLHLYLMQNQLLTEIVLEHRNQCCAQPGNIIVFV